MTPGKLNVNDVEHNFTFPSHVVQQAMEWKLKTPVILIPPAGLVPLMCGSLGEIHGFTFIVSPPLTPFERWRYRKDRLAFNRRKKQRRQRTGRRK